MDILGWSEIVLVKNKLSLSQRSSGKNFVCKDLVKWSNNRLNSLANEKVQTAKLIPVLYAAMVDRAADVVIDIEQKVLLHSCTQ